jgi:hypothetical protein
MLAEESRIPWLFSAGNIKSNIANPQKEEKMEQKWVGNHGQ